MNLKNRIKIGAVAIMAAGIFVAGYIGMSMLLSDKDDSVEKIKIEKKLENVNLNKPKGEVVTYNNFDYIPNDDDNCCETCDELLNKIVYGVNFMNYGFLERYIHSVNDIGGAEYFADMEGKVVSSQIVAEEDECKLVKFIIDMKKTGKSNMKEGENVKYAYLAKYELESERKDEYGNYYWLASPLFDEEELSEVKNIRYYEYSGSYELECWGISKNVGFGFKDENEYEELVENLKKQEEDWRNQDYIYDPVYYDDLGNYYNYEEDYLNDFQEETGEDIGEEIEEDIYE
ncbi:MAG: hypothetical protein K6G26_02470 [Lachnospiraceae bacterium]|nr:hypothetical protein [Lachnospiraceae bacterium]